MEHADEGMTSGAAAEGGFEAEHSKAAPLPASAPEPLAPAAAIEIDVSDVLRLIQQFLREAGLTDTLRACVQETGVGLPFIDDTGGDGRGGDDLCASVLAGRWDVALPLLSTLELPPSVLATIYEQVVREVVEARDLDAAKTLLRTSLPLLVLREEEPARFARMEHLVSRPTWEASAAYMDGGNKESKRQDIVRALSEHVVVAPHSRLMVLLSQALKWQQHTGTLPPGSTKFDIFRGSVPMRKDAEEKMVSQASGIVRYGSTYPTSADFAPDGISLVTGGMDGIIEVYNCDTTRIRNDFGYQARDEFMLHEEPVLAATVSRDGELLATGAKDGRIKVWRLESGDCVRRFPKAHSEGVSALAFNRDGSQLLSAGYDGVARLHGLRSGKILKELHGHTGAITAALYLSDGVTIATASLDGSVRIWDSKALEAIHVIRPPQLVATSDLPIVALALIPRTPDHLLLVPRAGTAYIMTHRGNILKTLTHGLKTPPPPTDTASGTSGSGGAGASHRAAHAGVSTHDFVAAAVSPQGKWIYLGSEDNCVYVFSTSSGRLEHTLENVSKKELLGVTHHPLRNLLATYGSDGTLHLWKP